MRPLFWRSLHDPSKVARKRDARAELLFFSLNLLNRINKQNNNSARASHFLSTSAPNKVKKFYYISLISDVVFSLQP